MATGSLVYFPKQATLRKSKPTDKRKPEPKSTVIELRVKSFTRRGVTYNVTYSKRKWTCDCPDARHRGNACKHVAILRLLGPRRAAALAGCVR